MYNKKSIKLLVLFMFTSILMTYAQSIKGIVVNEDKSPLEFVSIALLQQKDSLLVQYTSTGKDGKFDISGFKEGTYMFQVYLMTYQVNQRVLNVGKSEVDLSVISLKKEVNRLDEIVVNAIVPIKIKQDTIAFNSKAFKVKQDDNVEDLIKKLPGVQISTDGTVNAHGENVTKILVDGKEFFNNDMTIALKNLNADAVKSVQIIDEESNETRTTGIKDGEKSKIINLVLKEGKKSGYFGKIGAGIGTNDRYTSNFDLNRFTKSSQLAMFGNLNNINNTGATVFRRDGSRGGSDSGYLTTGTAGANYNYEFKKDFNFNLDYHYGYSDREEEESSERTEFARDKIFTSERENNSQNISNNHNVNFSLRDRSKKGVYLSLRGSFKNDDRESDSSNSTIFFDGTDAEDVNSTRETRSNDTRNSGNLSFYYNNKISEKGRNIRIRSKISFSDNSDFNFQNSLNKFNISDNINYYESKEISTRDERKKTLNYEVSFRYMEPIIEHHFISFSTEVDNSNADENLDLTKTVNEIVQSPFMYQLDYKNKTYKNQFGYVYSKDKIQVYLSGSLETKNQNLIVDNSSVVDNKYNNIFPVAKVSYEYKKGKRIRFKYNRGLNLPNSNEVTPIINDFNPLFITVGNVNLTPEKNNEFSLMFYSHEFKKATSFFSYIGYTKTENTIVRNRSINDNYIKHTTYENYGSKSNLRGHLNFSKKINNIGLRYGLRAGSTINNYSTIIDNAYNDTDSKSWNLGLNLSNENKNNVDVQIGAKFDFNKTTYSLQEKDRDYFKQNYYTKFDWDITNSLTFNTQFDYSLYSDDNFDSQTIPIWNMALEYAFLNGKRGNLKFQVFDILDKDLGIERISSDNYFEETFKKSLGTYAMLTFTYNIKPPTGKRSKRNSDSRRHGGHYRH